MPQAHNRAAAVAAADSMKISMVPNAAIALGLFCGVESFVMAPLPAGRHHRHTASSSFSSHMIGGSVGSTPTARTSSRVLMMGGFGGPVKKKKPAGVGRGQEAYQRQMKSFNGLVGAGADGVDVYVHREVSLLYLRYDMYQVTSGGFPCAFVQQQTSYLASWAQVLQTFRGGHANVRCYS